MTADGKVIGIVWGVHRRLAAALGEGAPSYDWCEQQWRRIRADVPAIADLPDLLFGALVHAVRLERGDVCAGGHDCCSSQAPHEHGTPPEACQFCSSHRSTQTQEEARMTTNPDLPTRGQTVRSRLAALDPAVRKQLGEMLPAELRTAQAGGVDDATLSILERTLDALDAGTETPDVAIASAVFAESLGRVESAPIRERIMALAPDVQSALGQAWAGHQLPTLSPTMDPVALAQIEALVATYEAPLDPFAGVGEAGSASLAVIRNLPTAHRLQAEARLRAVAGFDHVDMLPAPLTSGRLNALAAIATEAQRGAAEAAADAAGVPSVADLPPATEATVTPDPVRPPSGSADEVLAWVGDDPNRAAVALSSELRKSKPRKRLVPKLEAIAGPQLADQAQPAATPADDTPPAVVGAEPGGGQAPPQQAAPTGLAPSPASVDGSDAGPAAAPPASEPSAAPAGAAVGQIIDGPWPAPPEAFTTPGATDLADAAAGFVAPLSNQAPDGGASGHDREVAAALDGLAAAVAALAEALR